MTSYVSDTAQAVHRKRARYLDIEGLVDDPSSLEQQMTAASRLEATADHIVQVVDDEQLAVVDTTKTPVFEGEHHFRFNLAGQEKGTPPKEANLDGMVPRNLDQLAVGADLKRNMLSQRIAGLTAEAMIERVRNLAILGQLSQQNQFFYRATGLLKQSPELTPQLATIFFEPDTTYIGQAFIADLLVGADTAESQGVIQQILDNQSLQQRKSFAVLYQRIGAFSKPRVPLAEFAARQYETHRAAKRIEDDSLPKGGGPNDDMPSPGEARWIRRVAATYSLGAVTFHLFQSGDVALALKYNEWLLRDLREAKTPEEIDPLLHGLGNAGILENLDTILEFTRHPLAEVRVAAASALHRLDVAPARARLLDLLEDSSIDVQRQAQRTLDACALSDDNRQRLQRIVREGKANNTLDAGWVGFFDRKRLRGPDAESALSAIALRHPENSDLQRRITAALGVKDATEKPPK